MIKRNLEYYRPCVGIMLLNDSKQIFLGQRSDMALTNNNSGWQMPQGGIDPIENFIEAAKRELFEETNINDITILAHHQMWLTYDYPAHPDQSKFKPFVGQKQKWVLAKLNNPLPKSWTLTKNEFCNFRWASPEQVIELIVPFKKMIYKQIMIKFQNYL